MCIYKLIHECPNNNCIRILIYVNNNYFIKILYI